MFSDSIKIADQVEAARQSRMCRAVHVHKKHITVTNKKSNHKHDQDKSTSKHDQDKNTGKHDQDKPQRIKIYPKEVDIKAELMSRRQNSATLYGSSP